MSPQFWKTIPIGRGKVLPMYTKNIMADKLFHLVSLCFEKGSGSGHVDLNQIPSLRAFHNAVNSIIHDYIVILLLVFNRIGQFEFHNKKGFQVISRLYFVERGQCLDVFCKRIMFG